MSAASPYAMTLLSHPADSSRLSITSLTCAGVRVRLSLPHHSTFTETKQPFARNRRQQSGHRQHHSEHNLNDCMQVRGRTSILAGLADSFDVMGPPSFQLARYPGNASRYVRHADASPSSPARSVTAIYYLNPGNNSAMHALH